MAKSWSMVVSEVLHLGFEKKKSYDKNKESFLEAANWGQLFLCNAFPLVEVVVLEHPGGTVRHNLRQLTAQGERERFLSLASPAPGYSYRLLGGYLLELTAPAGTIEVWYRYSPAPLTANTAQEDLLELEEMATNILPYLMAYRLWLDDDDQKATTYYNAADDMIREALAAKSKLDGPGATVREDW